MRAALLLALVGLASPVDAQTLQCETPCAIPVARPFFVEMDTVPGVTAYQLVVDGQSLLATVTVSNGVVSFAVPPVLLAGVHSVVVRSPDRPLTDPTPLTVCERETWAANYFPNATLDGLPTLAGCETSLMHAWGTGGPPGLATDNFSARYLGTFTFAAAPSPVTPSPATYLFTARTDDGLRAWVDADQILDSWHDQGATSYTATRSLLGTHALRVDAYEHTGDAVTIFGWQLAPVAPPPILVWPCTIAQQVGTYANGDKKVTSRCPSTFTPVRGDAVKVER